uniref:RNase H type-1 domain-containing protein n=1 Tax=Hordeum vulgare subsp. vulgare TaxID=112509 RepID=A0A8I6X063_HORVV
MEFFGGRKQSQERAVTGWTKPEVGILKINSDGSYNKDTLTGGWGYIIRDHEGDVVVTAAGRLHHVNDALQAEAEACIRAIYKAQELGIGNVVMETDASTLVSAIRTSRYDLAPNGILFQEIKAFASLNFISFDIVRCPRACNKVADALAMHGSKMMLAPQAVWPGLAPTFAQGLVAADYGWRGD